MISFPSERKRHNLERGFPGSKKASLPSQSQIEERKCPVIYNTAEAKTHTTAYNKHWDRRNYVLFLSLFSFLDSFLIKINNNSNNLFFEISCFWEPQNCISFSLNINYMNTKIIWVLINFIYLFILSKSVHNNDVHI